MIWGVESGPTTLADRYELVEVVGRGGMGEVWAARDLRLDRDVAVKLLSPHMASQAGVRERFDAEARSAARLNHPNVIAVFDSGEHQGTPYLVMELLAGRTLADELDLGPLDPERARSLGVEVLGALAASHQAGVLHRDIKPGNLLVAADGSTKVGDFGIAKSTEGLDLTSAGMIVGTAAYLAPERLAGHPATAQADLYALGVVLYEALSGQKPFRGDTPMSLLRAVEAHDAVPLSVARPDLDASLTATVDRAMAADPARRFASAADMAAALQGRRVAELRSAPATTPISPSTEVLSTPRAPSRQVDRRTFGQAAAARGSGLRRHPATIVGAIIAAVVVLVIVLATRGGDPPQAPSAGTPPTTSLRSPAGALPEALATAIESLEEAVQP